MEHTTLSTTNPMQTQWRVFVRALAEEVDSLAGISERDDMLRGVGRRMARMVPLPAVRTLDALEIEANDALDMIGWGRVRFELQEVQVRLRVVHDGLPRVGSLGGPAGQWLSALLEGLYDGWLGQQPGGSPTLSARRVQESGTSVVMDYGRH